MNFIDSVEIDEAAIERACTRLVIESAAANDRQDYEAFAALFTPDGVLYRPSGEPLLGTENIVESYRMRPPTRITRHVCTNILITVESPEKARGLTYVIVYAADGSQVPSQFGARCDSRVLVGELEDLFRRTEDGWRIAERQARFVMHTS